MAERNRGEKERFRKGKNQAGSWAIDVYDCPQKKFNT